MTFIRRIVAFTLILALSQGSLWADPEIGTTLFSQGQSRLSLGGGYGSINNKDYGVVGLGAGYYLFNGLEAGVDGEAWLGAKPHIYTVSPEVRYVFYQMPSYKPYVGVFYKRSLYDTLSPLDSVGGRAGVVTAFSPHTYVSVGLVFENYFRCNTAQYGDCSQVYPEIGLSFVR